MNVQGWAGYRLVTKFKILKSEIKEWAISSLGNVEAEMDDLLIQIKEIEYKEESGILLESDIELRTDLKEKYNCKAKLE